MIEIKKGVEPRSLIRYRQQTGASYEDMDADVKEDVINSLLNEQGYLCAYCMRRIPETRELPQGVGAVSIEHWLPRNPDSREDDGQGLNYRNMLAVCSGNRGCGDKRKMNCDASKGNAIITVNPCDERTLRSITYSSSGRIKSSNFDIDNEINSILNLNNQAISLPENRRQVLEALKAHVKKNHPTGDISRYCRRILQRIKDDNPKPPYAGILIWWLENHM